MPAVSVVIIGTPAGETLQGGSGDDDINGRGGDDVLRGLAGDDWLDGWAGADRMEGGAGDDTCSVDNEGDVVVESLAGAAGGHDLVRSSVDLVLGANLEDLRLYGGAIFGTGNELANSITGNAQGNVLVGGAGDDVLDGGPGDDTLYGWDGVGGDLNWRALDDDGADTYRGGEGFDTYVVPTWYYSSWESTDYLSPSVRADLRTGVVRYAGYATDRVESIENITTGVGADRIRGDDGANRISVGGGANDVRGLGGDDTLVGGWTWNWLEHDPSFVMERLDGGAGHDVIDSGGSYWKYGTARSDDGEMTTDLLFGRGGEDRLIGGAGNFVMNGGSGADIFETRADHFEYSDYMIGVIDVDVGRVVITDFHPGEGDRISLRTGISFQSTWGGETRRADIPDFIGRSSKVDYDEVGYAKVRGEDGGGDTVLTYRYVYENDFTWGGGEEPGMTKTLDFRIVLEDFRGPVIEDWLTFL